MRKGVVMRKIDWSKVSAVFFDLDGTIYQGNERFADADKVVKKVRDMGKKVYFVTNNSASAREQICEKLRKMNISCEVNEIYSSGHITAFYVSSQGHQTAYIMGTDALRQEFASQGVHHSESAEVVVVGYDKDFDSKKLTDALQTALRAKTIIACNRDSNYPVENGIRMPGCGAMVGALEGSLGRKVDFMIGKPSLMMTDMLCESQRILPEEVLVVGDTYETDMKMVEKYGSQGVYIGKEKYSDCVTIGEIGELLKL